MQVETLAATSAQTRSGVRVIMHTGDHPNVNSARDETVFRLVGTRGFIECGAYGDEESGYFIQNEQYPSGETVIVVDEGRSLHQRYLEILADAMDAGTPNFTIAEESLAALEMCEAAYLSSKHRCTVPLPISSFVAPPPSDWDVGQPYSGIGGGRDGRQLQNRKLL